MKQVEERYISLLTDFGFKRIFGTAMNKDLLICYLNSLFNGRQVVKDVSYLNPEHVGMSILLRCSTLPKISMAGRLANATVLPLESYQKIFKHLKEILPDASDKQIIKLIG